MSAHLSWMIIRNNNAFLVKRRNIKKPFSKEPNNLNNMHAFRYNGLIHKKSIGIVDSPDKKGFTVLYKKASARRHPAKSVVRRTFKAGPRRALYKLRRLIRCNSYRGDLAKVALRKASAVLRSQRTIKAKKPRPTPAKAD